MSQSSTVHSKLSIEVDTGLSTMKIKVANGNPLDMQVAEALAECYERGIKQTEIMNALNSLKK